MTTTTELGQIDRTALKRFRTAVRVSFYCRPGWSSINTAQRTGKTDAEGRPEEITHEFRVQSYLKESEATKVLSNKRLDQVAVCSHMIWTDDAGDHARYWRTIAKLLKVGDRLELFWGRDYETNQNCRDHQLSVDRLTLHIHRGNENLAFILPTPVCKNNSARTIRRGENNNE
jgi:hypothetical protein